MNQPPPGFEIVYQTDRRNECSEMQLVLNAAGIRSRTSRQGSFWYIAVPVAGAAGARQEIDAYRLENPREADAPANEIPRYDGAVTAVVVYALILIGIAAVDAPWGMNANLAPAGEMRSAAVTAGELWRTVTALTLHADAGHIASNIAFGALFGILAVRIFGGGVAWLSILTAGALGNGVNALLQDAGHRSIGASTAVFGALGMLVAHALRPRMTADESLMRRWRPLIGGSVLLAFIGVGGERTDTGAHFTGFLAGILVGAIVSRIPHAWLANRRLQNFAGLIAAGVVMLAWLVALIAAIEHGQPQ